MKESKNLTINIKESKSINSMYLRIGNDMKKTKFSPSMTMSAGTNWFNANYRWYERIPIIGKWLFRRRWKDEDHFVYIDPITKDLSYSSKTAKSIFEDGIKIK